MKRQPDLPGESLFCLTVIIATVICAAQLLHSRQFRWQVVCLYVALVLIGFLIWRFGRRIKWK